MASSNRDNFIDFIYIGAPRSGSTWLSKALNEHPQIWIPPTKEVHFFNDRHILQFEHKYSKGITYYRKIFESAPSKAKLGELSPLYYFDPSTAYRVHKHFPNTRIIAFLRNPVDVVFSYYLLLKRLGKFGSNFESELVKSPQLLDLGFYHRNLTQYFDWFPKEQIHIEIYENFFQNPSENIKGVYRFIEVSDTFCPSMIDEKINAAGESGSFFNFKFLGLVTKILNRSSFSVLKKILESLKFDKLYYNKIINSHPSGNKSKMNSHIRQELLSTYKPDIKRLENSLKVDLKSWLYS